MRKTLTAIALTGLTMGAMTAMSGAAYAADADLGIPPVCTITDRPSASFDPSTGELKADVTTGVRCLGTEI